MKNLLKVFAIVGLTVIMSACMQRYRPVLEPYGNVPHSLSIEQVGTAIERACAQYNWIIESKSPGLIRAKQAKNQWAAIVNINYNTENYCIMISEAYGLHYDRVDKEIHGHYNTWVRNLAKAIDEQLAVQPK